VNGPAQPPAGAEPAAARPEHTLLSINRLATGDAALRYAALGVPVLALFEAVDGGGCACGRAGCDRPGKHPRTPRGHRSATTDAHVVARWWRWWPRASVGAVTGHLFDVWDIDLPAAHAAALIEAHLPGVAAPMARTGSGGTHVFFALTGLGNRTRFLPGCDWRGAGGFVVLPPSIHATATAYRWLADPAAFPPVPPSLHAALGPQPVPATAPGPWHAPATGYPAAALRLERDRVAAAQPGGRNSALNRAAFNLGQLVAAGSLDEHTVAAELARAAHRCGLPATETARTIASGLRAGMRHPRTRRGAP
jgi:Bifunctional DNA primase/polymerase, N-terminal